LIESGLPQISDVINSHAAKSDALPKTLAEVRDQTTGDARTIIDRNLVEYTPGKEINAVDLNTTIAPENPRSIPPVNDEKAFAYTLCVTYKAKKGSDYYPAKEALNNSTSPDTYQHAAGRVCYDLVTGYSGIYY
jgi:hypothetical protein